MFLHGRNKGVKGIWNQLWPSSPHWSASYLRLKVKRSLSVGPGSGLRLLAVGTWCNSTRPDHPDKHEGANASWEAKIKNLHVLFQSRVWGHWNSKTLFCTCLPLSWCRIVPNEGPQHKWKYESGWFWERQERPITFLPPHIILGSEYPRLEWF